MRTLAAVNAVFAAVLLLLGIVLVWALGITGLFFFVPGLLLALLVGVTVERSRLALVLMLAADAVLSQIAVDKLVSAARRVSDAGQLTWGRMPVFNADTIDILVSVLVLGLVTVGIGGVLLDWRAVRAARWFEGPQERPLHR